MNRRAGELSIAVGTAIGIFLAEIASNSRTGSLLDQLSTAVLFAAIAFFVVISLQWFTARDV